MILMNVKWSQYDIPDLTSKVAVVTGANSGLGFESSRVIASRGATVVMACRNLERANRAKAELLRTQPGALLDTMELDNASLDSVHAFSDSFRNKYDRLDILANNAGVMAIPYSETIDGFETQIGVNHLAHFALTGLLLDLITRTPKARIHNVTSSASFTGKINFADLMGKQRYGRWTAYGQSKLANVLFTFELQKRLRVAGHDTLANTSHPGLVIGNLQANSVAQSGTKLEAVGYRLLQPLLAQDITMGVLPMLYGMTAKEALGGVLYGPRWFNFHGYPSEKRANKAAYDPLVLTTLWQLSEQLTGVTYDLPAS